MSDGAVVVTAEELRRRPLPGHGDVSSKHERGGVLVVAGTDETPGAALLAGVAALRAGAGRLQVATAERAAVALAVAVPEARVIAIDGRDDDAFDAAAAEGLTGDLEDATAVLVGSGTFGPDRSRRLVARAVEVLSDTEGVLVLDAGALPLLAETPDLVAPLGARAVVMPNPSEAARMLAVDTSAVTEDPQAHLAAAVDRFGCVVTLRGGDTWTTCPGGPVYLDHSGAVGLATCGSGDVLAGLITGLAARDAGALTAVLWATQAHSRAGRRCAVASGPIGFLARDLLDEVGPALIELSA